MKEAFSLPLRKDSDFLDMNQRFLADSFEREDSLNLGYVFYLRHFTIHAEETVLFARSR